MEWNGYRFTFSCTSRSSKPNQSKTSQIFLKRILILRVSRVKLIVEECLSHLRNDWLDFERLNVIWVCDPEFSFPRRNVSDQMQACWRDEISVGKSRRIRVLFKGHHLLMGGPERGLQRETGSLEFAASLVPRRNGIWTHPEWQQNLENILAPTGTAVRLSQLSSYHGSLIPVLMNIFVILRANLLQNQVK